jgi:hypothetical protein
VGQSNFSNGATCRAFVGCISGRRAYFVGYLLHWQGVVQKYCCALCVYTFMYVCVWDGVSLLDTNERAFRQPAKTNGEKMMSMIPHHHTISLSLSRSFAFHDLFSTEKKSWDHLLNYCHDVHWWHFFVRGRGLPRTLCARRHRHQHRLLQNLPQSHHPGLPEPLR